MIVKQLRAKRHWSQEQLATYSGLSLRTIQRIESGQLPSVESKRCLAAVFEIEIDDLNKQLPVIDKDSPQWKQNPWWLRTIFWGSNIVWLRSRKEAVLFEVFMLVCALAFLIGAMWQSPSERWIPMSFSLVLLACTYIWSILIRLSDQYQIWQTQH